MNNVLTYIFILISFTLPLKAQNPAGSYNPYVNGGIISPAPLWTDANSSGVIAFNVGNTGSDPLQVYTDQQIVLTITLSQGEPDHINPLTAIGGSSAELFSWTYNSGTFMGTQIATVPASSSGTITIDYKITQNSALPGSNGFIARITAAPYQSISNTQNDDAVSSYTYAAIQVIPTGLTLESSTESLVSISWNDPADNLGVTGYRVYRGGTLIGTTTSVTYTDNTVTEGNTYTYTVSAINAAGDESAQSSPVNASTVGTQVVITPASYEAHELFIYPNPSADMVTLEIAEYSGKFNLVIFLNNGSIVQQSKINFNELKYNLNLNHLNTGAYNIMLFNDKNTYFGKLVIQK